MDSPRLSAIEASANAPTRETATHTNARPKPRIIPPKPAPPSCETLNGIAQPAALFSYSRKWNPELHAPTYSEANPAYLTGIVPLWRLVVTVKPAPGCYSALVVSLSASTQEARDMSKILATFVIVLALGTWSVAQTQQSQSTDTNKSSSASGFESGPTVDASDHSATIRWETNDKAATTVKYGTAQNNPQQRAYKPGGAREHEADLKNLQARQTYFFQILKRDGSPRTTGQFQYQPQSAGAATPGPAAGAAQQGALQFTVGPSLDTVADR